MNSPKKKCVLDAIDSTLEETMFNAENITLFLNPSHPNLNLEDFLRQANPLNPLERACAAGKKNCMAMDVRNIPGDNNGTEGFLLREFYLPPVWKKILADGKLPEKRTTCYVCKKFRAGRFQGFSLRTYKI